MSTSEPQTLAVDLRPAQSPNPKQPVVLLHGWGHTSACWQPLSTELNELQAQRDVYLFDLPGFGSNAGRSVSSPDDAVAELARLIPESSLLMGWSLGGNLALRLAARFPNKVAGIVTIASNPCFVARTDWPHAMPRAVFREFESQFGASPEATLKRFCALQAQGDSEGRALLKLLRDLCPAPTAAQLPQWQQALGWLAQLDNRADLQNLPMPLLQLFGEGDGLVPAAVAQDVATLNGSKAIVLPAGHAPHLSAVELTARHIAAFIASCDRKMSATASANQIDKQRMASSFSRAAQTYDSVAHVQTQVGEHLLRWLPKEVAGAAVLDLGCGTGFCSQQLREQGASVTALDIAPGMLAQARQKLGDSCNWVCADAEQLPFAPGAFNGVVSNLTVQWSADMGQLLSGLAQVLAPGGWLLFSTLGPDTLHELRTAWSAVDGYTHVNRFVAAEDLQADLTAAGLDLLQFERDAVVPDFDKLQLLMRELKALGAHNANVGQNRGLTSPRDLRRLTQAYEQFRKPNGKLPATYEVFYLLARRPT